METTGSIQNPFMLWPQAALAVLKHLGAPILVGRHTPMWWGWLALKLASELRVVGRAPPLLSQPLDEDVASTDWRPWVHVQRLVGIRGC